MLQVAQELIRASQLFRRSHREQTAASEPLQGGQCRAQAQTRIAAAANNLKHLGHKLDLSDPSRSQFDVVVQIPARDFRSNLGVQFAQGRDGAEIEMATVDERRDQLHQPFHRVAGDLARFHPGIALPFPPLRVQVVLQHRETHHQRAAIPVGSQPHVHAEHIAVSRELGQRVDELAPEAGEVFVVIDPPRSLGFTLLGVEKDQIDVR